MTEEKHYYITMTGGVGVGGGLAAVALSDELIERIRAMHVPIFPAVFGDVLAAEDGIAFIERVIGARFVAGWKERARDHRP